MSRKIRPFFNFCIENFPFIEATYEAMDNYELWCLIVKKLNEVVDNTNKMGEIVDKINNYFVNLNVQNEINNKLDEMAESGELQEIMASYLNTKAIFGFNNIQELKSSENLINGSFAKTTGYYVNNDGGSALYKIRNITNTDIVDEKFLIALQNVNLVAELIIENNSVNIKQLGARSQYENQIYNIHDYVMAYVNYVNTTKRKVELYIPAGDYHTTQCDIVSEIGVYIRGDFDFTTDVNSGTSICAFENNQNHIFNIGNNEVYTISNRVENIKFTTLKKTYNENTGEYSTSELLHINKSCLNLLYVTTSYFDNILFMGVSGCCFTMASCWEIYFKLLNYRYVDNLGDGIMKFLANDYSLTEQANISACTFENIMFERTHGNLINVENYCSFGNNKFGTINFENAKWEGWYLEGEYTNYDDNNLSTQVMGEYMFNIKNSANFNCDINDIVCNNIRNFYFTRNNQNYSFTYFIRTADNTQINCIINNINIIGMKNNVYMLVNSNTPNNKSSFIVNNIIISNSKFNILFDVNKFPYIRCNNIQRGSGITDGKYSYSVDGAIIPFYKKLIMPAEGIVGKITNQDTAISDNNFVSRIGTEDTFYILNKTDNIIIRAKIPNGTTTVIKLKVGPYEGNVNLVGDGSFKNYNISDIHSKIGYPTADGIIFSKMLISKVSGSDDSFFDCFTHY